MKSSHSFFHTFQQFISGRFRALSSREKILFGGLVAIIFLGLISACIYISNSFSVEVPTSGGTLREGILGTPRFINPVLATSDVDQDLSKLVYSGLVRRVSSDNGTSEIIPDLAESYTVSEDGKVYTFILKKDAKFSDHKPVRAEDVVFTIKTIQDNQFQSPLSGNWIGVSAEAINDTTLKITLPRSFSGFLDSATVGILPKHIWGTFTVDEFLASNYNTRPIGSGPYKISAINRDSNGIATNYTFKKFTNFALGKPFIQKIVINLYPNEQNLISGYQQGDYDILANIHPYEVNPDTTKFTTTQSLPKMFGLFLNAEKDPMFKDTTLRSVINSAIDTSEIINNVFQGYAQSITNPLPELSQAASLKTKLSREQVNQTLDTLGWKLNSTTGIREKNGKPLSFTISTADAAELKYSAQIIQKQLKEVGIATELQIFQLNDLENSVIKKRSFDALLFGQFIKSDADLYAFWHSSQANASGLNITAYTNKTLDNLIEKLFATIDINNRQTILNDISRQLSEAPVIWLYQTDFVYALRRPVYGMNLTNLINKPDRFATIYKWYLQTDTVWKMFTH